MSKQVCHCEPSCVYRKPDPLITRRIHLSWRNDWAALFRLAVLASPFKSTLRLQAGNAVLRHQLNVLRRRLHGRVRLTNNDRWFPSILQVLTIIRPETLVRWHRAGFRCYGSRAHWEGDRNGEANV
jgi:hypothetical protein